ncbi:hypothetical protein [Persicobacter psychrovividus]|uniref:Lipoprotein n=1 Tax=Persicobacter psychrovividus TaxID=387638 RepID=A0ABM7VN35_9BACT|nr:hypothetical protein PEPS_46890 [Persicobacter psychrovividus]
MKKLLLPLFGVSLLMTSCMPTQFLTYTDRSGANYIDYRPYTDNGFTIDHHEIKGDVQYVAYYQGYCKDIILLSTDEGAKDLVNPRTISVYDPATAGRKTYLVESAKYQDIMDEMYEHAKEMGANGIEDLTFTLTTNDVLLSRVANGQGTKTSRTILQLTGTLVKIKG